MTVSNRRWLPPYCDPETFLPTVQETVVLFQNKPYLFSDFVGKAISFLKSDRVQKMGFHFDPKTLLPCTWKCSDEAVFGVDLSLYAYTGHYPFDKGSIGGCFNAGSIGAAVHHSKLNVDFGGAHVGYIPGPDGGKFGHIPRPLRETEASTDCGYLMKLIAPFKQIYDDACKNILFFRPEGEKPLVSVPNEFLQPNWSGHDVKLLVDVERLTAGLVPYNISLPHTHKIAGRSLFFVNPVFLDSLDAKTAASFCSTEKTSIGCELVADYFHMFDASAELRGGVPVQRILPYAKHILSSKVAPYPLKIAVTHANIEYNILTDTVRAEWLRECSFASFAGVFIDLYSPRIKNYINLFQPIGVSIKPAGRTREVEITPAEIHEIFDRTIPSEPVLALEGVLGYKDPIDVLEQFTFQK